MIEPTQEEKVEIAGRATKIESGGTPLLTSNIPLGIPEKPDLMATQHGHAMAPSWTMTEMISQKKLIGTYFVTGSTPVDQKIWSFRHNFDNVINLHFNTFKNLFRLWSWTLNFEFQFRSNWQQVGQLLVVNHTIPKNVEAYLCPTSFVSSYKICTMLSHQKIPMGEDVDVTASLKWDAPIESSISYPSHYPYVGEGNALIPSSGYDMGEIFICAPISMQIANGVNPRMTVRVWSWLTDLKYSAYVPNDNIA